MSDEPIVKIIKRIIDDQRKKTWMRAIQNKKDDLKIVCGFISCFEDDDVANCSKCGREISIRRWLKKEAEKHSIPIICLDCCIDLDKNEVELL